MLDLIKLYAKHAAWYTQNKYDEYGDQHYDFDQCLKYHRELKELVVPRYMNESDLYNLLNFIYRKSEQTQRKRGRGPENLWQLMIEAKSEFQNSTFAPSEYMIEHIEKLAEHSAWVALNDRARYHADKENDIKKIEEHYQALLEDPLHRRFFQVYANKYPISPWPAVHVGIQVNGREHFFDGAGAYQGVTSCDPRRWNGQDAEETVLLGRTDMSEPEIENIISNLSTYHYTPGFGWGRTQYDVGCHNCQDFANHFAQELGVGGIPISWRQTQFVKWSGLGLIYWVGSGKVFFP